MAERQAGSDRPGWFIPDRPIRDPEKDEFSHETIAQVLIETVQDAVPPATIGLLGPFGAGKTSIVNLAVKRLRQSHPLDVVHVTADKHSGEARSRNIVHAVAGEMVNRGLLNLSTVNQQLRSLRSSVSLTSPAPGEMRLARLFRDPQGQSLADVWSVLGVGALLFVILLGASLITGGPLGSVFSASGILALMTATLLVLYRHASGVIESFFDVPSEQEHTQRAEAADDVERVFAKLVEKHWDARKGRRLVIFVDDIDRLGAADVLDAMRAIKSLQAVPRDKEPIFVVSCDERVILAALQHATETSDEAEAIDSDAGLASVLNRRDQKGTARAYIEKFFSLRVYMPPHVDDDMPRFIQKLLPESHPLRTSLEKHQLDSILLVLARGDVASPRHLIHRLNRFIASYRLAIIREGKPDDRRRLHPGDATDRPVLLARLTVLAIEFEDFYAKLIRDEGLLRSADRLARHDAVDEVDRELLLRHRIARHADRDDETSSLEWAEREGVRTYLVSTFPSIEKTSGSLVPLLYLAEPESGRVLGNERVGALVAAVRNGDAQKVEELLTELPEQHLSIAGAEIRSTVGAATAAELGAVLAGAVAAVRSLDGHGADVADTVADRLQELGPGGLNPDDFLTLLESASDSSRHGLLRLLAQKPEGATDEDHDTRMLAAVRYLGSNPGAPYLAEAVTDHLDHVDDVAGWDAAPAWITAASLLDSDVHGQLIGAHLVPAMYRLARADTRLEFDDSCRALIELVQGLTPEERKGLVATLRDMSPESEGAWRLLITTYEVGCPPSNSRDALLLSKGIASGIGDSLESSAVELLASIVDVWKDAQFKKKDDEGDEEEPRYVANTIGDRLAGAIGDAGPSTLHAIASSFSELAESDLAASAIAAAATERAEGIDEGAEVDSETFELLSSLLPHIGSVESAENLVGRIFAPLSGSGEQTPKVSSVLALIEPLGGSTNAEELLQAEATKWRQSLVANTQPFDRDRQEAAFQRLAMWNDSLAGEIVGPALATLEQRVQQGTEVGTNVRLIAALPWPPDQLPQALNLVASRLGELASPGDVTGLMARAERLDVTIPEELRQHFVQAVEGDPARLMQAAASMWGIFTVDEQHRMLLAGCGTSRTAEEVCASLSAAELAPLVVKAMKRQELSDVIGAADAETLRESLGAILDSVVAEGLLLDQDAVQLLTPDADTEALIARLVDLADADAGNALAALTVMKHLDRPLTQDQVRRLDAITAARLGEWTTDVADLLHELRGSEDLDDELRAIVDEMMEGPDASRAVAQAFRPRRKRKWRD